MQIQVKRSKRKTACLRILQDGTIEVRGPKQMTDAFVQSFVESKRDWIMRKREEVLRRAKKTITHTYTSGDVFYYLGEAYVLSIVASGRKHVKLEQEEDKQKRLFVYTTSFEPAKVKKQLVEWYTKQASVYMERRVQYFYEKYADALDLRPISGIVMENRKGRWGSCSSDRELTFNWRLMMAPQAIIDYVIVHELCHLKYMNHSPKYWETVASVMGDYKERKAWLRENGVTLNL